MCPTHCWSSKKNWRLDGDGEEANVPLEDVMGRKKITEEKLHQFILLVQILLVQIL